MTLRRSLSVVLATVVAAGALAAAPGASAQVLPVGDASTQTLPQPVSSADGPQPTHVDPPQAGVRLGASVPTSELVDAAGVGGRVRPHAGRLRPLSTSSARRDVLWAPAGRSGLRGLVQHVAPSCTGTGTDGNRVQVVYAVEAGRTDRYQQLFEALQSYVADVDDTFALSSRDSGRRVRWVSDDTCTPVIDDVVVPRGTLARPDLTRLKAALRAQGYTSPHRKYLVFADAAELCGVGDVYLDDRASQSNRNNGFAAMYARVDTPCWSVPPGGHSTPAHELMHMLGAVQPTAPHATAYGHCTDEHDAMCYADGDGQAMRRVCTQPDDEQLFDCNRDDYFDPRTWVLSPYLSTHWNTADSSFLDRISMARNVIGLPPAATVSGPARLRPGLGTTLSVRADRPVQVRWSASPRSCLAPGTSGSRARVQCPTNVRRAVTVTATLTADDGTVARVNHRITLSAGRASMDVALAGPSEVPVGEPALLAATVRYKGRPVNAALSLQQYAGRSRGWVTIATSVTGGDGSAEFTVRRDTSGSRTYRVQVRSAKGSGWRTSGSSSLVVGVV
jgi:hypothetical protein